MEKNQVTKEQAETLLKIICPKLSVIRLAAVIGANHKWNKCSSGSYSAADAATHCA